MFKRLKTSILSLLGFFFFFFFPRERKRERGHVCEQEEGQRVRERDNPKQAPYPGWILMQDLISQPRDHEWSQNQESDA